jgi:hypothetical protein
MTAVFFRKVLTRVGRAAGLDVRAHLPCLRLSPGQQGQRHWGAARLSQSCRYWAHRGVQHARTGLRTSARTEEGALKPGKPAAPLETYGPPRKLTYTPA